jgi:2,4-dienoyl-CoA reductase-like NADH-dependent reductase (Old Yellow Enzyme family)
VGFITDFEQAEAIIGTGDADLVALARAIQLSPERNIRSETAASLRMADAG